MARTLVGAHGLGDLAVGSAPSWLAVTLAVNTHPMGRAAGVNAVHCRQTRSPDTEETDQSADSEQNMQRPCDIVLTFLAVLALITSIADAGAHDADAVSSAVDVDALVDRHVALGALPPAVALAAAPRVLTVPAAQHWTGSWTRHRRGDESVTKSGAIGSSGHTDEQFSLKFDRVCSDNNIVRSSRPPPANSNILLLLHHH